MDALSLLPPNAWRTYAGFSDNVKADIDRKLDLLAPVLALPRGHCAALRALAQQQGLAFITVYRWARAAQGGDLHGLANKCKDTRLQNRRAESTLLPAADIALWKSYAVANQRKLAPAWRAMIRDWQHGKITTTQPIDPMRGHPQGWSLGNLRHHAPGDYELAAMRQGRHAASNHRTQVLTTRVGLRAGQFYVGDDVWHDNLVAWPGQRTPVRTVEASVLDLSAAALIQSGLRPRRRRADGTQENLTEREVRYIVAATLRSQGYRADELGTTWLVESGTFAIRDPLAGPLLDHFGIRVESSSILGDRAWAGAYGAKGGGNARFKTWLESLHNLRHNELAALPGQVGKDRDHKPEELGALVRYAEKIADAEERLALVAPGLAARLRKPVLTYHEFTDTVFRVTEFINARRDHRLQGWAECGHEVVQYLVGDTLLDEDKFLALPTPTGTDIAAWGRSLAEAGRVRTRLRSPAEVWRAGRRELTPLPTHGVALILGRDLGREQKVDAGEFIWEDADLGPGEWRYYAEITTPEGRRELLRNGESYLVHANPFWIEELCVSDAQGRFLGVARRHARANRTDAAAMQEQFKAVAAQEAELQAGLAKMAEPMMRDRLALRENNAGVLEEALRTRERAREDRAVARIDTDQLLADRARAAAAKNEAHPAESNQDSSWV